MVSTIEIKRAIILQPFISYYVLREFNTGELVPTVSARELI